MPPHHPILGHLKFVAEISAKYPANTVVDIPLADLCDKFPDGIIPMDFAPFNEPITIITSPRVAAQAQTFSHRDKPPQVVTGLEKLCVGPNLVTMPDKEWKPWRALFSKGFSNSYMLELVPAMLNEIEVFKGLLDARARTGERFKMSELTSKLTVDVITSAALYVLQRDCDHHAVGHHD